MTTSLVENDTTKFECPICTEEYDSKFMHTLKCSHKICNQCAFKCFESNPFRSSCPFCRAIMQSTGTDKVDEYLSDNDALFQVAGVITGGIGDVYIRNLRQPNSYVNFKISPSYISRPFLSVKPVN